MIQTGITVSAILAVVGAYLLSMYGIYQGQSEGKDEINITYISVPSVLNCIVVIYLLYYLLYIRGEKHTFVYKIVGTVVLIAGLLSDIYFDVGDKSLRSTGAATGMMYTVSTINFIVRLFYIIQFQCTDPFGRKVKPEQPKQQQQQQQQKPRPESLGAIGGKRR